MTRPLRLMVYDRACGALTASPGEEPSWPLEEGGHVWSSLRAPATISFLHGTVTPGPVAGGRVSPPSRRP